MPPTQVRGGQIKDGDITDADIAAANKDGAIGTPSMRTLGTGALQALAGNTAFQPLDADLTNIANLTIAGNAGKVIAVNPGATAYELTTPTSGGGSTDTFTSVKGFHLEYDITALTTIEVWPGKARDSTDAVTLTTSTRLLINAVTNGSALGNDSFQGAGTVSYVTGSGLTTGVGTSFLTAFGKRVMTGTITSSGLNVTGTGTRFLDEVAIGDLIGTDAKSYRTVTSIQDHNSLILSTAPTVAFAGETPSCIENPGLKIGPNIAINVLTIVSDTSLTANTGGAAQSGVTYRIGNWAAIGNYNMYVYVVRGSTGTSFIVSTQRTTPYSMAFGGSAGITGYNQYFRRIGSYAVSTDDIVPFSQWGEGDVRYYHFECAINTCATRVLSAGASAAWANITCHAVAPSTARAVIIAGYTMTAATVVSFRKRGAGATAVTRPLRFIMPTSASSGTPAITVPCDGAQYIQYASTIATADVYLECVGYVEWL